MLQPLLQAFAALGTSLADEMIIRGIIQQNGLIPLVYQVISGDISLYESLTYYITVYNLFIYIFILGSSIVTLCFCYPVFLGHSSIYPGLLSKSEIASMSNILERFGATKTWPQFRAQICTIQRK